MKKLLVICVTGLLVFAFTGVSFAKKYPLNDPAYGAEVAAGWLAEELGIKESKIICTGYKDLDAPVIDGDLVCVTQGAHRYAFHFKIKREPDVEYIVIGAWDLSVAPSEQEWIKIGATIVGHTTTDLATGGANEQPISDEILQRGEVEQTVESQHADPLFSPQMADGQQGIIPLQEKQ